MYYYGARYYAAWIGRFISIDPLAEKFPQLTPYNYAGNKPVTAKDLEGLQSTKEDQVNTTDTDESTYENNKRINDSDRRNTKDYGSFKEIDLDYAERKLNSLVDKARDNDYDFAADNLEHFLGNTGEERIIHKNEVLADINMRNLIRENLRKIWVNKITPDSENLEIGESKSFDNYYVDSTNALLFSDNYYASGGSTIKTTAKLNVTRTGDMSWNVSGVIQNTWSDDYDWHVGLGVYIPSEGMVGDELGNALSLFGRAKTFKLKSSWETNIDFNIYGIWGILTWNGYNNLRDSVTKND